MSLYVYQVFYYWTKLYSSNHAICIYKLVPFYKGICFTNFNIFRWKSFIIFPRQFSSNWKFNFCLSVNTLSIFPFVKKSICKCCGSWWYNGKHLPILPMEKFLHSKENATNFLFLRYVSMCFTSFDLYVLRKYYLMPTCFFHFIMLTFFLFFL